MPHIKAVFPDSPEVRGFLRVHKADIREVVAGVIGYRAEDIALFPDIISERDLELADGLLPLEFVIDSGTRSFGREGEYAQRIYNSISTLAGAKGIRFGVWLVSHVNNGYAGAKD